MAIVAGAASEKAADPIQHAFLPGDDITVFRINFRFRQSRYRQPDGHRPSVFGDCHRIPADLFEINDSVDAADAYEQSPLTPQSGWYELGLVRQIDNDLEMGAGRVVVTEIGQGTQHRGRAAVDRFPAERVCQRRPPAADKADSSEHQYRADKDKKQPHDTRADPQQRDGTGQNAGSFTHDR